MSGPIEALAGLVRRLARDVTYARVYAATVELQHSDGSVDLRPDTAELRGDGLQRVPVMVSPAGTSVVTVNPGTRCLIGFADGDPRKPRVLAWEYAKSSAVLALAGGQAGVARNGDAIDLELSASTSIAGVISGEVESPNPSPPPATITTPVPAGTPFTGFATIVSPIRGRVFGGAQRIRA